MGKLILLVLAVAAAWWIYKNVLGKSQSTAASAIPSAPPRPAEPSTPRINPMDVQIDPESIFERQGKGEKVVFVDVREAAELAGGMIDGAIHIPSGQVDSRFTELQPSDEIVLYCASGMRSTNAALFMRGKGYDKVWSLVGGFGHWQRDGGKTMSPSAASSS